MKNVLVGFFQVPGYGLDSVETELAGNPTEEYARLRTVIRRKHPRSVGELKLVGSVIEPLDKGSLLLLPGTVLAQLFSDRDTCKIGRVFFSGAPFDVVLRLLKAQGAVTLELRGVLRGDGNLHIGNKISPQRLASELPELVREALGREADVSNLKLNFRMV